MREDTMLSDWHRVGAGLSVRFTMTAKRLDAEWGPRLPTKREMKRVIERYRAARNQFLAAVGARMGGPVICLEVPL